MINEVELKRLDLNLLLTFSALMQERSTLGAARRLYLGQSAISMALRRLRNNFDDQLFVRVGRNMEPTPKAEFIYAQLLPALQQIQQTMRGINAFDPAQFDFELRLGVTDDIELPLMPSLQHALKSSAPNVDLSVRQASMSNVVALIEAGDIDLSLSYYPKLPKWINAKVLGKVSFLVVYDPKQISLASPLTAEKYAQYEHILVSFSGTRKGIIDYALEQRGLKRRIAVALPSASSVPGLLKRQAMITTLPSYTATYLAQEYGFETIQLPIAIPEVEISLVWHRKRDGDPQHQWARKLVQESFQENCFSNSCAATI